MKKVLSLIVAIAVLITAVPVLADDYDSMMSKAQSYLESGDTERALASYRLAERGQPERPDAYLGEADLLLELGNVSEALEIVNSVLEKDPFLPEAWVLKCRIDIANGDAAALESDQLYAEVCDADLHDLYPEIARFYFNAGNYSKAVENFGLTDTSDLPDDLREMYQQALTQARQETAAEKPDLVTETASRTTMDQAFDEDRLVLKKADLSEEILGYEFDLQSIAVPDNAAILFLNQINEGAVNLYSLSPSGNSGIYLDGTRGYALYEGTIREIRSCEARGVPDKYGNLEMYANKTGFETLFGKEGVVYSHNGQFAALYNTLYLLKVGKSFLDPILIDLSTGEMFLTATYEKNIRRENGGYVTTACFSSDDRYFYYLLDGNIAGFSCALYRYDMENKTTELCCPIPYYIRYPSIYEYDDGSFIIQEDQGSSTDNSSVVQLTQTNGRWTTKRHEYSMTERTWNPTQLVYSEESGYAFVAGKYARIFNMAFMAFKPGADYSGFNMFHAISKESQEVVNVNEDILKAHIQDRTPLNSSELPYEAIFEYELSPDGNYALILTKNTSGKDHLYMLRLETLELKEVKGIDPSTIRVGDSAQKYQPIIEWNTETLIIITTEGIETYEFDY